MLSSNTLSLDSPQKISSIEAFDYIKHQTNSSDIVAFAKPWAMILYTERSSMPIASELKGFDLGKLIKEKKVNYILASSNVNSSVYNETLILKLNNSTLGFGKIWENNDFEIWQKKMAAN
jgi:hypothetical protein